MSIKGEVQRVTEQANRIHEMLHALIRSLPPNPNVKLLNAAGTVGVVKASALGNNWSPTYHLNASMAKRLCEIVERTPAEKLEQKMGDILDNGRYPESDGRMAEINRDALSLLRKAWYGFDYDEQAEEARVMSMYERGLESG